MGKYNFVGRKIQLQNLCSFLISEFLVATCNTLGYSNTKYQVLMGLHGLDGVELVVCCGKEVLETALLQQQLHLVPGRLPVYRGEVVAEFLVNAGSQDLCSLLDTGLEKFGLLQLFLQLLLLLVQGLRLGENEKASVMVITNSYKKNKEYVHHFDFENPNSGLDPGFF